MLDIGAPAPEFELPNQYGESVALTDFQGQRLVLYFYPRANTSGCTTEATGLRDAMTTFRDREVAVVGVSDDPVPDLEPFAESYDLPFDLLSDEDGTVSRAYDSYGEKTIGGKTFEGVFRNTYVIDAEGRVAATYENVSPEGHADAILADLEA